MFIYYIFVSVHLSKSRHRVLRSHRSKMGIIYIYIFAIIKKCAVPVRPRGNLRAHCFHDYIYILHTYTYYIIIYHILHMYYMYYNINCNMYMLHLRGSIDFILEDIGVIDSPQIPHYLHQSKFIYVSNENYS